MNSELRLVDAGHLGDPQRSHEGEAFWRGCARGEFLIQECTSCRARQFPWGPVCRRCWSDQLAAIAATGRATLWSYTVIDRAPDQEFAAATPYVVALVQLAEGPRAMSRLVGASEESLRPGLALQVAFASSGPGETVLPVFIVDEDST